MVKRFFSQAWLYHKARTAAFDWREFLFFDTGYPIITLVFYCLLAAYSFQTADLTHWVIGNSFLMCVNTCIFGLGSLFRSERYSGRLRSIIAAPCSLFSVVLSYGFIPSILAMGSVVLGLVVGAVVFGIDFSGVNLGLALLTILCAMIAASGFGLLLSVFGLLSDGMHLILNMMNYILMIFTGAEFPVSQLPAVGQVISRALPLTRSIEAMNLLFSNDAEGFAPLLLGELAMAAIYVLASVSVLKYAERACKRAGKFDLF